MKSILQAYAFQSSSGNGTYQTLVYDDRTTSCNCPGWTRRMDADGNRRCKHTLWMDMGIARSQCLSFKDYTEGKEKAPSPVMIPKQKREPKKPFYARDYPSPVVIPARKTIKLNRKPCAQPQAVVLAERSIDLSSL